MKTPTTTRRRREIREAVSPRGGGGGGAGGVGFFEVVVARGQKVVLTPSFRDDGTHGTVRAGVVFFRFGTTLFLRRLGFGGSRSVARVRRASSTAACASRNASPSFFRTTSIKSLFKAITASSASTCAAMRAFFFDGHGAVRLRTATTAISSLRLARRAVLLAGVPGDDASVVVQCSVSFSVRPGTTTDRTSTRNTTTTTTTASDDGPKARAAEAEEAGVAEEGDRVDKKARFTYEIVKTYEAGIQLVGTEVKSCRAGQATIRDAWARVEEQTVWLYDSDIAEHKYTGNKFFQHDARRPRRLLMHKSEARKLRDELLKSSDASLRPLSFYFNERNILKVELALCRNKNLRDKRQDMKAKDDKREMSRITKNLMY
eukprot:CAMPEP_0198653770 /NCGR_PEP_ID=MMETSP1467-20131203/7277_1 /TAXON_ID=1462469 /ORGANISM="unid. sp., Strain CCMP2135" /LENGTH=373 /DNA_ID=CAMNT_0044389743 /DNA_START=45 /DNA_END=1169 /DNA_ORIENTATION=-